MSSTARERARRLLDRRGARWLLACGESVHLSRRRGEPVLVTPRGGWWVHRYRSGAFAYPGFGGAKPEFYESVALDSFCHAYMPTAGDVVVDLGAGIGEEALVFSRLAGRTGRVVCVEAHPETFARLELMVRVNKLRNVTPLNVAVADRAGSVELSDLPPAQHIHNSMALPVDPITVAADTVDGIYERFDLDRVDLLKMNIEGGEAPATAAWDEALGRTRNVAISCHDFLAEIEGVPPGYATFDLVKAAVEDAGFAVTTRPDDPKPWNRYYVYGRREDGR